MIDVKSLLLPRCSVADITFIKNSYWAYLEFQLNMLVSVSFALPALLGGTIAAVRDSGYPASGLWAFVVAVLVALVGFAKVCI